MLKLALTIALAAGLTAPAFAGDAGNYDGTWSVELVTVSGLCDARYNYALSVQDGQVRPVAKAATSGATVTGRVGADGSVGLNVATSAANGSASGRLQARSGSGTGTSPRSAPAAGPRGGSCSAPPRRSEDRGSTPRPPTLALS